MAKYLDYNGLSYFWEKVKAQITALQTGKVDDLTYDTTNHKITKTKNGTTTDVVSASTLKTDMGLANVEAGAQVNKIETIQKNGTNVPITTGKVVNISVPTKTSDITNDSGFITIDDVPEGATASTTVPIMDGTAATGTEKAFARGDHVHPTDTSRAPVNHASSATTYGVGTSGNYGHVKLSDATNETSSAASNGTAATPKAVKDALDAAKTYADSAGVTGITVKNKSGTDTVTLTGNIAIQPGDPSGPIRVQENRLAGIVNINLVSDSALSSTSTNPVENRVINSALELKAPLASPALTGTPTAPTAAVATDSTQIATTAFVHDVVDALDTGVSDVTVDGTSVVTSGVAAIDLTGKQDNITGAATTITDSNLTASKALISNSSGKVAASSVSSTELGYVSGVTSAIQTQLNAKAPLASPALTGTPTAPTATAGTNTTQIATTAFVKSAVETAVTGVASFQGTAPTTFAPTNYKKGYYWVVGTAGTYAGETCEPGDMIFCTADYVSAYSASDFDVVQTNLDITSITNAEIDTIMAA